MLISQTAGQAMIKDQDSGNDGLFIGAGATSRHTWLLVLLHAVVLYSLALRCFCVLARQVALFLRTCVCCLSVCVAVKLHRKMIVPLRFAQMPC